MAETLSGDRIKVSEWCDLWVMKLNASKTMIVSMQVMQNDHQSPPLTICGAVLKQSDDLVILEVTFDSKMYF